MSRVVTEEEAMGTPAIRGSGRVVSEEEAMGKPINESEFRSWYSDVSSKYGLNPDPDDPRHYYDYRAAWQTGVLPDKTGHWPSRFKTKDHPNRYVDGIDTITGKPRVPVRPYSGKTYTSGEQEKQTPYEKIRGKIPTRRGLVPISDIPNPQIRDLAETAYNFLPPVFVAEAGQQISEGRNPVTNFPLDIVKGFHEGTVRLGQGAYDIATGQDTPVARELKEKPFSTAAQILTPFGVVAGAAGLRKMPSGLPSRTKPGLRGSRIQTKGGQATPQFSRLPDTEGGLRLPPQLSGTEMTAEQAMARRGAYEKPSEPTLPQKIDEVLDSRADPVSRQVDLEEAFRDIPFNTKAVLPEAPTRSLTPEEIGVIEAHLATVKAKIEAQRNRTERNEALGALVEQANTYQDMLDRADAYRVMPDGTVIPPEFRAPPGQKQLTSGVQNAEAIRSDAGQVPGTGIIPPPIPIKGGKNLQRKASVKAGGTPRVKTEEPVTPSPTPAPAAKEAKGKYQPNTISVKWDNWRKLENGEIAQEGDVIVVPDYPKTREYPATVGRKYNTSTDHIIMRQNSPSAPREAVTTPAAPAKPKEAWEMKGAARDVLDNPNAVRKPTRLMSNKEAESAFESEGYTNGVSNRTSRIRLELEKKYGKRLGNFHLADFREPARHSGSETLGAEEMTLNDYLESEVSIHQHSRLPQDVKSQIEYYSAEHRSEVEQSIEDGRPVPAEVLADYPDLAPKQKTEGAFQIGQKVKFGGRERTIKAKDGNAYVLDDPAKTRIGEAALMKMQGAAKPQRGLTDVVANDMSDAPQTWRGEGGFLRLPDVVKTAEDLESFIARNAGIGIKFNEAEKQQMRAELAQRQTPVETQGVRPPPVPVSKLAGKVTVTDALRNEYHDRLNDPLVRQEAENIIQSGHAENKPLTAIGREVSPKQVISEDMFDQGTYELASAHNALISWAKDNPGKMENQSLRRSFDEALARVQLMKREWYQSGMAQQRSADMLRELGIKVGDVAKEDPTFWDYVHSARFSNMLSAPATHLVNTVSNITSIIGDTPSSALIGAIDPVIAKLQGRPREFHIAEAKDRLKGYGIGIRLGSARFIQSVAKGEYDAYGRLGFEQTTSQGAFTRSPHATLRSIAPVVEMPSRLLSGEDAFTRSIVFEGEAANMILAEGKRLGLTGNALDKYVADGMKNIPIPIMKQALAKSQRSILTEPLGGVGTAIDKLANVDVKWKGKDTHFYPFRFLLPFRRTPGNILKRGIELTPGIGASMAMSEPPPYFKIRAVRSVARERGIESESKIAVMIDKEIRGGSGDYEISKRARQLFHTDIAMKQAVAVAATVYFWSKYQSGELTGAAPRDASKREIFYLQGKKPNQITFGGTSINYDRFEPFTLPISMIAAAGDFMRDKKYNDAEDAINKTVNGFGSYVLDRSYLQSLADLISGLDSGNESAFKRFERGIAQSMVPGSALLGSAVRSYEASNEGYATARKPETFVESLKSRIPGLSGSVPPRLDAFGQPVRLEGGAIRQAIPFKWSQTAGDDIGSFISEINNQVTQLGYPESVIHLAPLSRKGVGGKNIESSTYQDIAGYAGSQMLERILDLRNNPIFNTLNPVMKATAINRVIEESRELSRRASVGEENAEYKKRRSQGLPPIQ